MQTCSKLKLIKFKVPKYMVVLLFPYMSSILKKGNEGILKSEDIKK